VRTLQRVDSRRRDAPFLSDHGGRRPVDEAGVGELRPEPRDFAFVLDDVLADALALDDNVDFDPEHQTILADDLYRSV
jgi:hypothetical protein